MGGYPQVHPYVPKAGSQGSVALQKALDWMLKKKKKKQSSTVICYKTPIWSKIEEMRPRSEMQR